jgi:hypothetical protein
LGRVWIRLNQAGWGQVITVAGAAAAALAAIVGLWFQAVATYWSQQTAKDQLEQSREDGDREKREQASRVTAWFEDQYEISKAKIHVLNRSPDPVGRVDIVLLLDTGKLDGKIQNWRLVRHSLEPCTELVYPVKGMKLKPWDSYRDSGTWSTPSFMLGLAQMYFYDRDGRNWIREGGNLSEQDDYAERMDTGSGEAVATVVEIDRTDLCEVDARRK